MKRRGQTAVEYILLIALGLFIIVIGFGLAFYVKNFTDAALQGIAITRNETITLFLR